MTSATRIEGSWLAFGWGTGLAGAVAVTVLAYPLIPLILGKRYVGALALIPVLALAEAIRGVTTVYNTYLSARGIGKALRNAAIALTLSNLAFNLILIPPFGAMGAAWASVGALVVNLVAHVVSYRKSVHVGETSRPLRWLRA
jgi:O-antigen/teichoic acid export membrane protein